VTNPDRIDFTALPDRGGVIVTKMRRDASASRDIPIESETKSVDFDLANALAWCKRNGYTVRQWYGGARAWKGPVWIIRTRQEIVQKRRDLEAQALAKFRQNPGKWHREESHLALDLAYDG